MTDGKYCLSPILAFALTAFTTANTSPAQSANWQVDVAPDHPQFCRQQAIRVNKVAGFLMSQIYSNASAHNEYGFLPSGLVYQWKLEITKIDTDLLGQSLVLRGESCGIEANKAIYALNLIWEKLQGFQRLNSASNPK